MATSEILGFAESGGANVISQSDYVALATLRANGFSAGVADSAVLNKVWRQSSFVAAGLAQFVANQGISVVDDGDIAGLAVDIQTAVNALITSAQKPAVIDSATFGAGTANGHAVYFNPITNTFDRAIADGTISQNCVGFADVTNSKVYLFGDSTLFAGLSPGSRYYLSDSVLGAITSTKPSVNVVSVGIAKTASILLIDIDQVPTTSNSGSLLWVPGNTAPAGYLKANGALLSRTTYAALWAYAQASGNLAASDGAWSNGKFSPGDGSTTFRIPDLRGYFLRAWSDGSGVDSGRLIGTTQSDDFKSHTHTFSTNAGSGSTFPYGLTAGASSGIPTGATGGTETRPVNVAMLACIKY